MTEVKLISSSQLSKKLSCLQLYKDIYCLDDVLPKMLLKFWVHINMIISRHKL